MPIHSFASIAVTALLSTVYSAVEQPSRNIVIGSNVPLVHFMPTKFNCAVLRLQFLPDERASIVGRINDNQHPNVHSRLRNNLSDSGTQIPRIVTARHNNFNCARGRDIVLVEGTQDPSQCTFQRSI